VLAVNVQPCQRELAIARLFYLAFNSKNAEFFGFLCQCHAVFQPFETHNKVELLSDFILENVRLSLSIGQVCQV